MGKCSQIVCFLRFCFEGTVAAGFYMPMLRFLSML